MTLDRRRFLACASASLAALALDLDPRRAQAMGRTPLGGRIAMHVPWSTRAIDPHDIRDGAGALFGSAISDPLFALDAAGNPYPALAAGHPSREAGETIVRLREGLRTARGKPLDARDLVASFDRARARGAAALLADLHRPATRKDDPLAVSFGHVDPGKLARALASPLCALLPRRFDPGVPDGTGAFRADIGPRGILLHRNPNAARGASFLDSIEVAPADDLKTSLRAFEAERDDIGWLGTGLHEGRKGAVRFDLGSAAWIVLITGTDAGSFGLPGVAQKLCDAIPPARLAHLGLGALPASNGDPRWGGPSTELYVDNASPHLIEIARTVASILTQPGHELTATPVPRPELNRRKAKGKATLAIEIVRPLGPSALHTLLSLATVEDPIRARDLARSPPRIASNAPARSLTGMLRVGVLGELRIQGGAVSDIVFAKSPVGDGWDLGATHRKPGKR